MTFNNTALQKFLCRFDFKQGLSGYIGVEREHFLVLPCGTLVPRAPEFLERVRDPRWTYELSACQIESRTKPHRDLLALKLELLQNGNNGSLVAERMGLRLVNREVASKTMPLDVFPNPRYARITRSIPIKQLQAACRVAGTHIHLGTKNMEHAIRTHNALIGHLDELSRLGDHSEGKRLKLYKAMAKRWLPAPYENEEHFFENAQANGFAENPRDCWTLIRISAHGTVEVRAFGVTDHVDEILHWISRVWSILQAEDVHHA